MPWKIRKPIVIVSKELAFVLRERFLWNEVIYLVLLSTEFPGKKWIVVQVITAKFKHKRKPKKVLTNLKLARNFSSNSHHQCSKWTPLLNLLHLKTFLQTIMSQEGIKNLMLFTIYKEPIDDLNLSTMSNEFSDGEDEKNGFWNI